MPVFGGILSGTSSATQNQLQALTRRAVVPAVIVQIYQALPTMAMLLRNAQKAGGGLSQISIPVQTSSFVNFAFSGYSGTFQQPTDQTGVPGQLQFNLSLGITPVGMFGMEAVVQSTETIVPILKARMADMKNVTLKGMASAMYGLAPYNNPNDNTLPANFFQAYDDGTNYANYGGLSRTTYSSLQSIIAPVNGKITRMNMHSLISQCTANSGGEAPDFGVLNLADWENLAQDMMTLEQIQTTVSSQFGKDDVARSGFRGVMIQNVPIFADPYCPAGSGFLINTRYLALYLSEAAPFVWSGFQNTIPLNQVAYIGAMLVAYNIVCTKPKTGMQLSNITNPAFAAAALT